VLVSTPTVKGASRIEDWWEVSDKRLYHTPCSRCGARFVIEWPHVRWIEHDPSTAHLECPECHTSIGEFERHAMIAAGEWRPSAPFAGVAGFRAWEVFGPWRRLADIVGSFLIAKRNLETLRVWKNTCIAELWEALHDAVESATLLLRREAYPADVPAGVVLLTCGVDTQDDRLEALVVGWGAGEEGWIVARESLPGDPARPQVWHELDMLLGRAWTHDMGVGLKISACCVDAGGHRTQAVYSAVIPRQARRVFATFGRTGGTLGLLVSPPEADSAGKRHGYDPASDCRHRPGQGADLLEAPTDRAWSRVSALSDERRRDLFLGADRRAPCHETQQVRRSRQNLGANQGTQRVPRRLGAGVGRAAHHGPHAGAPSAACRDPPLEAPDGRPANF
jgi:phage terminase large subunit GpA-like protein